MTVDNDDLFDAEDYCIDLHGMICRSKDHVTEGSSPKCKKPTPPAASRPSTAPPVVPSTPRSTTPVPPKPTKTPAPGKVTAVHKLLCKLHKAKRQRERESDFRV